MKIKPVSIRKSLIMYNMSQTYLLFLCALLIACSLPLDHGKDTESINKSLRQLSDEFISPPMSARPGAFWCWLNGDMTKESITNDLEEMKDKGMSGAEIWDIEMRNDDK